jgi:TolB-like protein/DNA-binding winged helix-turn-helix (wHTH) protein/Tfp pilus assembly protein PilF
LATSPQSRPALRFDGFEVDLRSGELRKHGVRTKLQGQPFQVLQVLLENPGEIVSREELKQKLWPTETFVDFDDGLNTAVKKVRDVLGDSAAHPRYIETIPRRGYVFIGKLEAEPSTTSVAEPAQEATADASRLSTPGLPNAPSPAQLKLRSAGIRTLYVSVSVLAFTGALVGIVFRRGRDHLFGAGAPQIQSIAVLPFQNMSGDPSQEYFSDGTTEQLITDLAQIRSLKVISRTSAMRYKNSTKSLPEIGQELGVDAIVEGSVRRSEGRVRVTAQLVRAATDGHLWAKDYDRDVSDLLKLQADVAREIAQEIRAQLTPEEAARLARVQTASSSAEEEFWRGRRYQDQGSDEDLKRAIEHYSEAVQIQPDYALAYAGLANAWAQLRATNHSEAEANAQKAASRALELGPDLGETHVAMAMIDTDRWNWPEADKEFQAALRLDPTNVESCGCYAFFLSLMRRYPEAIALLNRGSQIDPLSPVIHQVYGMALSASGKPEEAIPHLQRALELDPGNYTAGNFLAAIYENSGKLQDALKVLSRPQFESSASHARLYALLGRKDDARAILQKVAERTYPSHLDVASIYFALGEEDQGFEWLNKGLDSHDPFIVRMTMSATLNGVRSDPRYKKLVARFNIPEL